MTSATTSDPSMAKTMVSASGRNILPSVCSSVKSGRKTTTMIRMAKSTGRATSAVASKAARAELRSGWPSSRLRWRTTFSVTTMVPSTTMPMAMASPPSDIRLAVTSAMSIRMNAISAVSGSDSATVSAARRFQRKMNSTAITSSPPKNSADETVLTQAWIKLVRS